MGQALGPSLNADRRSTAEDAEGRRGKLSADGQTLGAVLEMRNIDVVVERQHDLNDHL